MSTFVQTADISSTQYSFPVFYHCDTVDKRTRLEHMASFLTLITQKAGVEVHFSLTPSTDGKTIWLGFIDPEDEDFEALTLGHGIHEVMHVISTDMQSILRYRNNSFGKTILNVLEDIRIDVLGPHYFSGYKVWREELVEVLRTRGTIRLKVDASQLQPTELFTHWLHARLLVKAGYNWAMEFVPSLESEISRCLPKAFLIKISQAADRIFKAKNTMGTVRITETILKLWDEQLKALSAASSSNANRAQINVQLSLDFDSQDTDKTYLNFMQAVDNTFSGQESNLLEPPCESTPTSSKTESASKIIHDYWPDKSDNEMLVRDGIEYAKAFETMMDRVHIMHERIETLLATETMKGIRFAESGYNLARDWIRRAATGNLRIFEHRSKKEEVASEICILLDRSGSMGVKTMTAAKTAVLGTISALRNIQGSKVRAACFPGPLHSHVSVVADDDESIESITERFRKIGAFGSTPVREALLWGRDSFSDDADVQNRLLLVITDGRFPTEISASLEKDLNAQGIELAVVSIDMCNEGICSNYYQLDNVEYMEDALETVIAQTQFCTALRD